MASVMNISSYEIERDDAMEAEYGDEVLCSGWNPAVALVCQEYPVIDGHHPMVMPSSLATVDAEAFLQKMYVCQR